MTELSDLLLGGLAERGRRRGGEPLNPHAAWLEFAHVDEKPLVTYEVIRRILTEDHTNIGDRAAEAVALMSGRDVSDVLIAAGKRPRLGPFKLPRRADRLDRDERKVVIGVVNAILDAHEGPGGRLAGAKATKLGSGTPEQAPADTSSEPEPG